MDYLNSIVNSLTDSADIKPKNIRRRSFSKKLLRERILESKKIMDNSPDRVPVIVYTSEDIKLDKYKFLVPINLSVSQFIVVLRARVKLNSSEALFLFSENNVAFNGSTEFSLIYKESKNEDGFLYMYLMKENTFG